MPSTGLGISEIECADTWIRLKLMSRSAENNTPGFHDTGIIRYRKRQAGILLHQQNRETFCPERRDGFEDLIDQ